MTRIFSVGSNFLSKLAPLSFIKSLIFLYLNVLRPHILLISIFLCLFGAPPFFLFFFFFLNFDAAFCLTYILPFLLSHRPSVLYYFALLFVLCGAPFFTFVAVCLRLYIPIFYSLTFYAPIFCSSLFSFVYLAPRLSFTSFFSFLNFDAPICLSYILPFLLSHRLSVLYYFAFLFVLCGAHSFTFVAVCLRLYIPIFAILALLGFLLQFLSFKSLSICHLFYFSFPFLPFYVPFSLFRLLFLSLFFFFPFPFPFLLFPPSSLSSSFLLPLFDAPFGHFLAPLCGHPGCKRTLCTPQDTPLTHVMVQKYVSVQ